MRQHHNAVYFMADGRKECLIELLKVLELGRIAEIRRLYLIAHQTLAAGQQVLQLQQDLYVTVLVVGLARGSEPPSSRRWSSRVPPPAECPTRPDPE